MGSCGRGILVEVVQEQDPSGPVDEGAEHLLGHIKEVQVSRVEQGPRHLWPLRPLSSALQHCRGDLEGWQTYHALCRELAPLHCTVRSQDTTKVLAKRMLKTTESCRALPQRGPSSADYSPRTLADAEQHGC